MFLGKHIGLYFGWTVLMIMVNNGVQAWTYHYSTNSMEWEIARQWCRQHHTDIVAIQNKDEVRHLDQKLPFRSSYYWIGLRKLAGQWTWVGTMKPLAPKAASWAEGEPNDQGTNEDCVEIYIKRSKDSGMWNDDRCSKKKAALCFTASCFEWSCSEHGECVENIGNYTCKCNAGFTGPRCEEVVECPPITTRTSGWNMTCSHPLRTNSYTSTCVFSCEEGFELRGSNTTLCDQTGQWTHTTPTCTGCHCFIPAVTCDPVVRPQKGTMNCTDPLGKFSFRSSCDVSCEEGYKLRGENNLTCLKTGNWSAETPACEAVTCDPVVRPQKGTMNCTDPLGKFSFRSSCDMSCEEGYKLRGENNLTCLKTGNWSAETPACEAVQCSPLSAHFSDGKMNCTHPLSTNSYKSTCVFNCDEGFQLIGSNKTQCDHTGQWTPKTPTCKAVTCDPVVRPQKGTMNCTDPLGKFSFRSSCDVSCEEGYKLRGENNLTCLKTGNWSAETPACEAVTCDPVVRPQKGTMNCTDPLGKFSFRSSCDVSCEEGYKLRGENNLTCLKTGNWSAETPACEVVRCSALNAVPHGSMHCTDSLGKFAYGSVCGFECDVGFLLMGSNYTHCSSQGNWSHSLPVCQAVTCDPVVRPQKGTMNCTDPLGKFSFRSSCDMSCEEGYKLRGENNLTCLKTGNWSAETPACEVVRCSALNAVPHGSMHCTDSLGKFAYGSVCGFECDVGFLLMGSNYTHCSSQGNWSHSLPVCQAVQCSPLSAHFSDGKMNCTHPLSTNSYKSTCVFNCDEGFQLIGSNKTQCDHTGQWTPKTPTCKAVTCDPVVRPQKGTMNCTDPLGKFSFRSSCDVSCEEGYKLRGENNLTCLKTGNWSAETPACEAVQCSPLSAHFSDGKMNCTHPLSTNSYKSTCVFNCDEGFQLIGSNKTQCDHTGQWTPKTPTCKVEGMTVGTGFLVYGAVGAASALGLLLMGGLVMLMVRQFSKDKFTPDYSAWDGALNPAFEGL
ncbi:P-selectin isoform X4 [Hemibagrus wyckioides]|uniref:P-selectin isoform X4 n=1 Tax=Hemibagrus wyckioides TaxID=337641 RepID=UPI00266D15BD|nr:P-selectin isoform X4 [Hemibagrus wyckioides]